MTASAATLPPTFASLWRAMSQRYEPRNVAAVKQALSDGRLSREDGTLCASFVDRTPLRVPHVFVSPGRSYDWRFAVGMRFWIATRPGVDISGVLRDLFEVSLGYVGLVDVERLVVADVAAGARGLKLYPYRRGSQQWEAVFG